MPSRQKDLTFTSPPYGRNIASKYTKIIYDLIISIANKYFEFQNDWFKIIPIRHICTQFCPKQLCYRNQKFRITSEFPERYTSKSNQI